MKTVLNFRTERRRSRVAPVALAVALAGFGRGAKAQEILVLSDEIHEFASPLILEMSLDPVLDKPAGEKWTTEKTRFSICRGVTIESLEFRVQPESASPKKVDIRMRLNNNSGKDKRAHLKFECLDGDKVLCVAIILPNVEQGATDKYRAALVLRPPERWTQIPRPKLRITMTLQDY